MQKALSQLVAKSVCMIDDKQQDDVIAMMQKEDLISTEVNVVPPSVKQTVVKVTVEFAGVKFKAKVFTGDDYIEFVKNAVIMKTLHQLPKTDTIVICEEKYQFTPDDFKAATRAQRTTASNVGISHLKTVD